jgi:MFS family permease
VSVLLIALLRTPGVGRPVTHERPTGIARGSLEGLSFVWRDRVLRALTVLTMVVVAIYLPIEGVILPVLFEAQGTAGRLGGTLMALSAGGVAGSLLYGAVAQRLPRRAVLTGSLIGAALAILAMSLLPPYPVLVVAAALAGFFWGPFGPLLNLRMQTFTPPAMRGRVLGVLIATEYAAGPAGYLLVGWLVARFGPETVFLGTGVLMVAACLGFAALPALAHLDDEGPYSATLQPPDIKPPAT